MKDAARKAKEAFEKQPKFVQVAISTAAVCAIAFPIISKIVTTEIKSDYNDKIYKMQQELESANIESRKLSQLIDTMKSRIDFSVGEQKSFLDLKQIFVSAESLPSLYKVFYDYGFAVPDMKDQSSWNWQEATEAVLFGRPIVENNLDLEVLTGVKNPEKDSNISSLRREMKAMVFTSSTPIAVKLSGQQWNVIPNCGFSFIQWRQYDRFISTLIKSRFDSSLQRMRDGLLTRISAMKIASNGIARHIISFLNRPAMLPSDKSPELYFNNVLVQKSLEVFASEELGGVFAYADPETIDSLIAAYRKRTSREKSEEFASIIDKSKQSLALNEAVLQQNMPEVDMHADPKQAYLQIFMTVLSQFQIISGSKHKGEEVGPVFDELFFGPDHFVIKGYLPTDRDEMRGGVRLYFLRIGVRSERGVHLAGYTIPTDGDPKDVKNAQSMIHDFRVLK